MISCVWSKMCPFTSCTGEKTPLSAGTGEKTHCIHRLSLVLCLVTFPCLALIVQIVYSTQFTSLDHNVGFCLALPNTRLKLIWMHLEHRSQVQDTMSGRCSAFYQWTPKVHSDSWKFMKKGWNNPWTASDRSPKRQANRKIRCLRGGVM